MVQLVDQLLSFPGVKEDLVNNKGLSPLDIAIHAESQDKPNYGNIAKRLKDFGGTQSLVCHCRSKSSPWKSQKTTNKIRLESKIFDVDTLVASLIATVTFPAVFQVPGGTDKESVLGSMSLETVFHVFLFSDCLRFFASMTVAIEWIFRERFQTKLVADRSALAKLSMVSLGIAIVSTCLAFLSAAILVTIPRKLDSSQNKRRKKEYKIIFTGEATVIIFLAPLLVLVFLSL
ncbi:hypothetical protein SUGI_0550670 [Cryptomeria japonica]|nr:hypothetical protein SUGI_0550670 [Cryptomeria japonica]